MQIFSHITIAPDTIEDTEFSTPEGTRLFKEALTRYETRDDGRELMNYLDDCISRTFDYMQQGLGTLSDFYMFLETYQEAAQWMVDDRMAKGRMVHTERADYQGDHPFLKLIAGLMSSEVKVELFDMRGLIQARAKKKVVRFLAGWAIMLDQPGMVIIKDGVPVPEEYLVYPYFKTFRYRYLKSRNVLVLECTNSVLNNQGFVRVTVTERQNGIRYELEWESPDNKPGLNFLIPHLLYSLRQMGGELEFTFSGPTATDQVPDEDKGRGVDGVEL